MRHHTASLLAVTAGVCAAWWLPPSVSPPAATAAGNGGTRAPGVVFSSRGSAEEEPAPAPAPGEAEMARMGRAELIVALDALLREDIVDPARRASAAALAVRLFRGGPEAVSGDFPGARQFPPWLLAKSWLAALKDPNGVPAALAKCLPAQRNGLPGASLIARALGAAAGKNGDGGDADEGRAFVNAMPAQWRHNLREERLGGLAAARPLEALAEAPRGDEFARRSVLGEAARAGPLTEAFQALARAHGTMEETPFRDVIPALYRRDAAETRRLVRELGDEAFTHALEEVAQWADAEKAAAAAPVDDGRTLAERMADPSLIVRMRAAAFAAADDPEGAVATLSAMEDGAPKIELRQWLSRSLRETRPDLAFDLFKNESASLSAGFARDWLAADAPAAIKAVLSLDHGNELRENLLRALRGEEDAAERRAGGVRSPKDFPGSVNRRDLALAAQELPPELLREVTREE